MLNSGALDKTFLLLMGDHGFRMDFSWAGTDQGKTEASMPALAVLLPKHFKSKLIEYYKCCKRYLISWKLVFASFQQDQSGCQLFAFRTVEKIFDISNIEYFRQILYIKYGKDQSGCQLFSFCTVEKIFNVLRIQYHNS